MPEPWPRPGPAVGYLDEQVGLTLVHCPQCDEVASIEWRSTVGSTLYLKVRCINRHWFLLPVDMVSLHGTAA